MRGGQYAEALRSFQRFYWTNMLEFTRWNVTDAARIAGMNRCHPYRLLRQLGLMKAKA